MLDDDDIQWEQDNLLIVKIYDDSIRKTVLWIESISIVFTLFTSFVTAFLAYEHNSMAATGVSVDGFLDIVAYSTILWQFSNEHEFKSSKKDIKAKIILAFLFFISASWVEYGSISNFINEHKPLPSHYFIILSIIQSITFSIISIVKFIVCQKLAFNTSMLSSGINSLIAGLGNLSMTLSMSIYLYYPSVWYLDSVFGCIMGFIIFIYASELFISNVFSLNSQKEIDQ